MKLLLDESPLLVQRTLAVKIGLNEAVFLQQLHYYLRISKNVREDHTWVYNTYEDWKREFPFWSVTTIKRIIYRLEEEGYIVSGVFNKMRIDKTKWYRINYEHADLKRGEIASTDVSIWHVEESEVDRLDRAKEDQPITKEFKNTTKYKEYVETDLDVIPIVINYLNEKTDKQFKSHSKVTKSLLNARIQEGYTVDDFKQVIDTKAAQWLDNPDFCMYLRPSTLFHAMHFESYLNEVIVKVKRTGYRAPVIDYGDGKIIGFD